MSAIGFSSYRDPRLQPPDSVDVDESPYVDRLVASCEFFCDSICDNVNQLRSAYLANDPIALQKWIEEMLEREAAKSIRLGEENIRAFTPSEDDYCAAYEAVCQSYEKYDERQAA